MNQLNPHGKDRMRQEVIEEFVLKERVNMGLEAPIRVFNSCEKPSEAVQFYNPSDGKQGAGCLECAGYSAHLSFGTRETLL